jgi:hypothetical protein
MLRFRNALIKSATLYLFTPRRALLVECSSMLVLLCASADGALSAGFFQSAPTSRLRPRPVPVMAAATEEPVLRPQLMGAAALTGTATGVAVSGFKVAALGLAAALYAGPLALPELPGSDLGAYVLVRPQCRHHRLERSRLHRTLLASRGVGAVAQVAQRRIARHLHAHHLQVPALGGLASCALCAAVSPREDEPRAGAVSYGSPRPELMSGTLYGSGIGPDLAGHAADVERALPPTPVRSLARRSTASA